MPYFIGISGEPPKLCLCPWTRRRANHPLRSGTPPRFTESPRRGYFAPTYGTLSLVPLLKLNNKPPNGFMPKSTPNQR